MRNLDVRTLAAVPSTSEEAGVSERALATSSRAIEVDDLDGICAYFALADVFNSALYARLIGSKVSDESFLSEFDAMLQMALVLFDHVIVQCADCLRSGHLRHVLRQNTSLITDDSLLFVFNDETEDPAEDFKGYIEARRERYEKARYNDADLRSLDCTDDEMEETKELFTLISHFVIKGESGSDLFKELISDDLADSSCDVVFGTANTKALSYGLHQFTLHQLVTSKFYHKGSLSSVFNAATVEELVESWRGDCSSDAQGSFSRHTILSELKNCAVLNGQSGLLSKLRGQVIDEAELRLGMLYGKVNAGKHLVLDFDPARNKSSIHSIECFETFWRKAINGRELCFENVIALRNNKKALSCFRKEYYHSIGQLLSRPDARSRNGNKLNMRTYRKVLGKIDPNVTFEERP